MQNYINLERIEPRKREVMERIKDFSEIYEVYTHEEASSQADRCVQCGDPYCHHQCPLHNFIPQWLKKIAERDLELAFKISNESSPFPEIMGRVCPQDRLCEGDCTLNEDGFGAITIGGVETYISEKGFSEGMKLEFPEKSSSKKVAIIGSGPAGLSCATYLLRAGIGVEMFERADRAGGLLTYGIPGFKLDKSVVARRVEMLIKAGMVLHTGKEVGKDTGFDQILERFDAVFLGIGATKWRQAKIMNEDMNGCYQAMELLEAAQKKVFGDKDGAVLDLRDKNVVVIGGGDTAMDCTRTAIREGARSVKVLYRRDAENMPGSKKEHKNAHEEGAEFLFFTAPSQVNVDRSGKVTGLRALKTELGEKGDDGRQSCNIVAGSEFEIEADVVVFALGFTPEAPEFLQQAGIKLNSWKGVVVDEKYQTSLSRVYAGGDCYRGADLVVRAAYDGREAAYNMMKTLIHDDFMTDMMGSHP